ncbi:MAG: tetratricopeptide repeat protein, partial [Verrucomicrobiota bacterium]
EQAIRQALSSFPDDGYLHALMAQCLDQQKRYDEALAEAGEAVHLDPDNPLAHYTLAWIHESCDDLEAAHTSIDEAIRIDPDDPDYYGLKSSLHARRQEWEACHDGAVTGLSLDPEHEVCNNFRAMALIKLDRGEQADAGLEAVLTHNPNSSYSHATTGWSRLEQGDHRQAMTHFKEALRLDPENEWARDGIVTALKSGNPLYRLMLKWGFWMMRFNEKTRMTILGFLIVVFFFGPALGNLFPVLKPVIGPLRAIYQIFALLTWFADPFFEMLLLLNRNGRLVLTASEKRASGCFALFLLLLIGGIVMDVITDYATASDVWFLGLAMMFCIVGVRGSPEPFRRRTFLVFSILIGLLGIANLGLSAAGSVYTFFVMSSLICMVVVYQLMAIFAPAHVAHHRIRNHVILLGSIFALAFIVFTIWCWNNNGPRRATPLRIAEDTTLYTQPLDLTGALDVAGALSHAEEREVPDEENAAVALAELLGPASWNYTNDFGVVDVWPGADPPPETRTVDSWNFMTNLSQDVDSAKADKQAGAALAGWLASNEGFLERLDDISRMETFAPTFQAFEPNDLEFTQTIYSLKHDLLREPVNLIRYKAKLFARQGVVDELTNEVARLHRLGQLFARSPARPHAYYSLQLGEQVQDVIRTGLTNNPPQEAVVHFFQTWLAEHPPPEFPLAGYILHQRFDVFQPFLHMYRPRQFPR